MTRTLTSLFTEESASTEQSRLFKLITLELADSYVSGSGVYGSTQIEVTQSSDFTIGQKVTIAGIDNTFTVTDVVGNIISIDTPLPVEINNALIFFKALLNIADSNYNVLFDGVTYIRFPIKMSDTSISTDGSIDKASISVANVTREIMYYVEQYDGLVNRKVTVKTVYSRFLDKIYTPEADGTINEVDNPEKDPSSCITDEYIIDSYSANEKVVRFSLDPVIDLDIKLPRRRYMDSNSCMFKYRDSETCKYSGDLPICYKNLASCKAHNNMINFGGFPGLDSTNQRRIWL